MFWSKEPKVIEQGVQQIDLRSPYERVRDNYDIMHERFYNRKRDLERILEQTKTDLAECEAILISLEAGRNALNEQIVERGLLSDLTLADMNEGTNQ